VNNVGFTDLPAINSPTMNGDGWTPIHGKLLGMVKIALG
jgi:hypothetical protein